MRWWILIAGSLSCAPPASVLIASPAPAESQGDAGFDTDGGIPTGRVLVQRTEQRYSLRGSTAWELGEDLRRRRPRDERFTGWTRWRLRWRIDPARQGARCHPGPVDVTLELTTVLPSWTPPADADPRLVEAFGSYLEALEEHEAAHGALAERTAHRIRDVLQDLEPTESCDDIRALAHATGHAEVSRLRQRNESYDALTNHGATQGAVFPTEHRLDRHPEPDAAPTDVVALDREADGS